MSGERQCILVPMMRRALFLALACSFAACSSDPTSGTDAGVDGGGVDGARVDAARPCSVDADCDDARYCNGRETCVSGTCRAGTAVHCDDGIACTIDECVEARQTCHSAPPDADHDGSLDASCLDMLGVPLGDDCLDSDPNRYPGNHEICDAAGHDEDCNLTTVGTTDMDLDGYVSNACCNTGGLCGPDCDDTMLNRHPMAPELCNGLDDDCDMLIDEGLATVGYYPDCDMDGYGNASATPIMTCTVPPMAACASGGQWVMQAGDCADTDPMRHMGATEACNGVDDDCDAMIDDIIHGTVVCTAAQTRSCSNAACGTMGTESCSATCLAWSGRCVATEICNGCDDDGDGAPDNGFTCARGSSQACTVPTCGTPGTQLCSGTCSWGACTGPEVCNYCDDNGNGNFSEEKPQAINTATTHIPDCRGPDFQLFGPGSACTMVGSASNYEYWATLMDGTANNQAGAFWWSPSTLTQGWGTTEVQVDLELTAINDGGVQPARWEQPIGGWSVIIGRGGTPGVGTPQNRGIPTTVSGVAASWWWSYADSCGGSGYPPSDIDNSRFTPIRSGTLVESVQPTGSLPPDCHREPVGGQHLDGAGTVTQHITLRYTPDDPTTTGNEELVTVIAGGTSNTYRPNNDLPIGTGPLRIGITAGSYLASGFTRPAGTIMPSYVFGMPVRARTRIYTWTLVSGSPTGYSQTFYTPVTRAGLCP